MNLTGTTKKNQVTCASIFEKQQQIQKSEQSTPEAENSARQPFPSAIVPKDFKA